MYPSKVLLLVTSMVCIVLARMEAKNDDAPAGANGSEVQKTVDILVSFKSNDMQSIRNKLQSRKFVNRTHRIQTLYNDLKEYSNLVQANVLNTLTKYKSTSPKIEVHQLWISNQVIIKNADLALVKTLQHMDEVSMLTEDIRFTLEDVISKSDSSEDQNANADVTWGVAALEAPEVWASGFKGSGIVVADIDSGVRGTHEALRDGFREENGWFDAAGYSPIPKDAVGHGTHTTGTILGRTRGIGVAPEAQWIACRGCDDDGVCSLNAFMRCGQWALCPTDVNGNNPRCDLAPHVISNSWGAGAGLDYFDEILANWVAADIAPIFSAGNDGQNGCASNISPADSPQAISVGATDPNNQVTYFSSLGPAKHTGGLKPEIAAPGLDILSASYLSDTGYASASGTSMACPHVAGLAALLYSKNKDLTYKQFREVLIGGAQQVIPTGGTCGGVPDTVYPNNHAGAGRVSAKASIDGINRMLKA